MSGIMLQVATFGHLRTAAALRQTCFFWKTRLETLDICSHCLILLNAQMANKNKNIHVSGWMFHVKPLP